MTMKYLGSAFLLAALAVAALMPFAQARTFGGTLGETGLVVNATPVSYANASGTVSGYKIINLSEGKTIVLGIGNDTYKITVHYISPSGCNITVNGKAYTLGLGGSEQLSAPGPQSYLIKLVSVSYPPLVHSVTLLIYTIIPTTTTVPSSTSSTTATPTTVAQPAKAPGVLGIVPIAAVIGVAIGIAAGTGITYYTSKRGRAKGGPELDEI